MRSGPAQLLTHNPVKKALKEGRPAIGSWISLCSAASAEHMASVGWDWLVIDAQHSPVGFDTMVNSFRAIQLGGAVPMARVPWLDTVWIQRTLDAGALGLVIPMINSREEAERAVANCKYAQEGVRSCGGGRMNLYVEGEYREFAQRELCTMVMIETITAAERAEDILSVPGVDGCFIGPTDLALSMGMSPSAPGPEREDAVQHILQAAKKNGVAAGYHCQTAAEVNMRVAQGFTFLALASDVILMLRQAKKECEGLDFL